MKKQDAIKWIKALRSGEYKQTTNTLKDNDGFCCLGVLNEIFPKLDLSGGKESYLGNFDRIALESSTGKICNLNDVITDQHIGDWIELSLADLNDGTCTKLNLPKFTFDEIADIIQIEYVEGL